MKIACFLVLVCSFYAVPARGDGIPVSGTAVESQGIDKTLISLVSPTTLFSVSSRDDLTTGGVCPSGSPCQLVITVPASFMQFNFDEQHFTWIDGTQGDRPLSSLNPQPPITGFVEGQLVFPIPTFTPNVSPSTLTIVTGTTPFFGELSGFLGDFTDTQRQVFSVDLSGTAQYSISFSPFESAGGILLGVEDSDFTFEGTANPVPEPATLLLVGAGLAACARRARRRRPVC